MLTQSTLLDRVNKKIHNSKAKLGGDDELVKILNEANKRLQLSVDMPSTKRISTPFFVFRNIFEYPLPTDIAYDKTTQFKFEKEEQRGSSFEKTHPKYLFDNRNPYLSRDLGSYDIIGANDTRFYNDINTVAVQWENGNPYLKVKSVYGDDSVTLNNCDTITTNGTWSASGDATNLRTDNIRYKQGSGALSFDSGGSSTELVVTNSDITAVDLSGYEKKSKLFLWLSIPATVPASVTLKWGSDNSNYWSKTITTKQSGLAFIPGWNLLGFDWENSTETGTVDEENIDYLEVTIANSAAVAQTGYRLDSIQAFIGQECSLDYYSKYLVVSNAGVRKEDFDASDDQTILNEKEVILLIDEAAQIASENLREDKEAINRERIKKENIALFQADQPSEEEYDSNTYYNC